MIQSSVLPAEVHVAPEIEARFEALLDVCRRTLPVVDEPMLRQAFRVAVWAHRDMTRASGEPYVTHPLEVAHIYAEEMAMDDVSVAAALLHDVIEDTDVTLAFLRDTFGDTLAHLVDGLTKIGSVTPASREGGQAENVRKLMLSMAQDIRVILVKFADRLHNMRTLGALSEAKQKKIAAETIELYAPLAHRFGLARVKTEFEDRSLAILDPATFAEIKQSVQASEAERAAVIERFIAPLRARLAEAGFGFRISGRPKTTYSIYRKMKAQEKGLDEIYDLLAVRVVLDDPAVEIPEGTDEKRAEALREGREAEECWRAYSLVTSLYKPLPDRLHDYISVPKSNGYQSLHTTVIGPDGRRVEVQIRTQRMHEVSERGVAAHWKYKEGIARSTVQLDQYLTWVRDLLDARDEGATQFVRDFRLTLYDAEIYVFTPKGQLVTLPTGATPVDFAFMVHTEVGMHCLGAKVNGRIVPLSYTLHSGDQVEVLTSKKQTPNPDWIKFVVTHKAKTKIRQHINERRRQAVDLGRELWEKRAKKAALEADEDELRRIAQRLRFGSPHDMFYEIGAGLHDADELIRLARAPTEAKAEPTLQQQFAALVGQGDDAPGTASLLIDGQANVGITTQYASCCNPIPGDDIFGYVTHGMIKVHRATCPNALDLMTNHPERTVSVAWSRHKDATFSTTLRLVGEDRVGILSDVTTVISKNLKTNIRSITVDSQDGAFEGHIALFVTDIGHLQRVTERLRRVEGIHGVYRLEGGG
jgi:GTP diphosphokinase / guanosine-3',5'-bis(diphosphate) 3'-diphosphatase